MHVLQLIPPRGLAPFVTLSRLKLGLSNISSVDAPVSPVKSTETRKRLKHGSMKHSRRLPYICINYTADERQTSCLSFSRLFHSRVDFLYVFFFACFHLCLVSVLFTVPFIYKTNFCGNFSPNFLLFFRGLLHIEHVTRYSLRCSPLNMLSADIHKLYIS